MLSTELIKKKKRINKILENNKIDYELINKLRKECERIDIIKENIVLNFQDTNIFIDTKTKKIKSIMTYDYNLRKYQEFLF